MKCSGGCGLLDYDEAGEDADGVLYCNLCGEELPPEEEEGRS